MSFLFCVEEISKNFLWVCWHIGVGINGSGKYQGEIQMVSKKIVVSAAVSEEVANRIKDERVSLPTPYSMGRS